MTSTELEAVMASALFASGVALAMMRAGLKSKLLFAMIGLGILLITALFAIVAYVIDPLVSAAVSRRREYLADASAFEMTCYGERLITALEKIERSPRRPRRAAVATQSFYFASPGLEVDDGKTWTGHERSIRVWNSHTIGTRAPH
ncbi:M48 family metalloprotease [Parafrigoribacterium humi]|uniref:hypothetical protein n=1 Tax=Parafrigoribacterium humi TaxID=3144664 RepID=UPI0032EB9D03